MLRKHEELRIGDDVIVRLHKVDGGRVQVQVQIEAPRDVPAVRRPREE